MPSSLATTSNKPASKVTISPEVQLRHMELPAPGSLEWKFPSPQLLAHLYTINESLPGTDITGEECARRYESPQEGKSARAKQYGAALGLNKASSTILNLVDLLEEEDPYDDVLAYYLGADEKRTTEITAEMITVAFADIAEQVTRAQLREEKAARRDRAIPAPERLSGAGLDALHGVFVMYNGEEDYEGSELEQESSLDACSSDDDHSDSFENDELGDYDFASFGESQSEGAGNEIDEETREVLFGPSSQGVEVHSALLRKVTVSEHQDHNADYQSQHNILESGHDHSDRSTAATYSLRKYANETLDYHEGIANVTRETVVNSYNALATRQQALLDQVVEREERSITVELAAELAENLTGCTNDALCNIAQAQSCSQTAQDDSLLSANTNDESNDENAWPIRAPRGSFYRQTSTIDLQTSHNDPVIDPQDAIFSHNGADTTAGFTARLQPLAGDGSITIDAPLDMKNAATSSPKRRDRQSGVTIRNDAGDCCMHNTDGHASFWNTAVLSANAAPGHSGGRKPLSDMSPNLEERRNVTVRDQGECVSCAVLYRAEEDLPKECRLTSLQAPDTPSSESQPRRHRVQGTAQDLSRKRCHDEDSDVSNDFVERASKRYRGSWGEGDLRKGTSLKEVLRKTASHCRPFSKRAVHEAPFVDNVSADPDETFVTAPRCDATAKGRGKRSSNVRDDAVDEPRKKKAKRSS